MKFDRSCGTRYLELLRKRGIEVRSVVVRQDGEVAFAHSSAPFALDQVHPLYSVTKSFTSCAVGMLEAEGKIVLSRPWISYFPEYAPDVADPRFLDVTVRDLLTMQMGQDAEPALAGDDDWAKGVAGKPLAHDPGSVFFYNSLCSHLLSMLVERVSGMPEDAFLARRLFAPLGIVHWWWEHDRHGHATGGFGLHLATPDLAKFGQCLLDGGRWEGRQLIPRAWVAAATTRQAETAPFYPASATEDRNGYGYQFWMCAGGGFRCAGLFGQLCYVLPEEHLVVAASSSTTGSKPLMDALYDVLGIAPYWRPALPQAALAHELEGAGSEDLSCIPCLQGLPRSPFVPIPAEGILRPLDGAQGFTSLRIAASEGAVPELLVELERGGETFSMQAGYGTWRKLEAGRRPVGSLFPFAAESSEIAAPPSWAAEAAFGSFAWISPSTLLVETRELDSTRRCTVQISFDGNHIVASVSAEGMLSGASPSSYVLVAPRHGC